MKLVWPVILWAGFVAASSFMLKGGQMQGELYIYIPHYLNNDPVAKKLFDPQNTEINEDYQARELSYFFDWIDCHAIDFSARHGMANLLSVSFYGFMLAIILVLRHWMAKSGYSELTAFMAISVLLTCPFFVLSGSYMRSAKIGVTLCVSLALVFGLRSRLALLAIALAACWFDRQGVFLVMLSIPAVVIFRGWRDSVSQISILAVVLMAAWLYNGYIDPAIIHHLNGYYPSFHYQELPWWDFLKSPSDYIGTGIYLVENNISQICGGIMRPDYGLALLVLIAIGLYARRNHLGLFAVLLAGLFAMYMLMYLRHRPIASSGCMQDGYYYLPGAICLFVFVCASAKSIKESNFRAILLFAVLLNIYMLPSHAAMLDGNSVDLIHAIQSAANHRIPDNPELKKDPLYQFFAARYTGTPEPNSW